MVYLSNGHLSVRGCITLWLFSRCSIKYLFHITYEYHSVSCIQITIWAGKEISGSLYSKGEQFSVWAILTNQCPILIVWPVNKLFCNAWNFKQLSKNVSANANSIQCAWFKAKQHWVEIACQLDSAEQYHNDIVVRYTGHVLDSGLQTLARQAKY